MSEANFDVILVGAGVVGCAIATYLLKADRQLKILIIEKDSTYVKSSTVLCDGNIRIQFNLRENIEISLYGMKVMSTFSEEMATEDHVPEVNFRQQGNLYTVDEARKEASLEGLVVQQEMGCDVEWLEADEIQQYYPIFEPNEVVGATFGRKDGSMSPLDVLLGYRRKAISLGVQILEADVKTLLKEGNQINGVQLASGEIFYAKIVFNTTGAWAPKLAQTVGVALPIKPIKRQVYVLKTEVHFDHILPMFLLPTGQYIFHEGSNHFITGGLLPDDPVGDDDFHWDLKRFEERLWPGLAKYIPAFDKLKVVNGWAGLYATNTLDGNAILGEWPELKGFYCANGFSGHGFQQSHAVGRYLSELVLEKTPTLDLSVFSPQRILDNKPVFENPSRII